MDDLGTLRIDRKLVICAAREGSVENGTNDKKNMATKYSSTVPRGLMVEVCMEIFSIRNC